MGLTDQIVKRLGSILSGENLVTHLLNLAVMSSEVETSGGESHRSGHAILRLRRAPLNMTVLLRTNKEAPPVSQRGPLLSCPNYRVIVMQQAPGQQAPPAQQPSSLDEIVVALVSVRTAAIKSRYFIIPSVEIS